MLHSFDIFDTLITRTTVSPRGIFAIMKECLKREAVQGLASLIADNFYQIRVQGEELARSMYITETCQDVTLEEIYEVIRENYQLSDEVTGQLIQLELDTEYENILPITENIEKLKKLHKDGEAVILISDMYLSQSQIRKLLMKADPVFQEIKMYVSAEYKQTKKSGQLYRLVQRQERVFWDDWEHTGDNAYSDVTVPAGLGIRACLFSGNLECCWQKFLLEEHRENAALQLVAGATGRALGQKNPAYSYIVGAGYSAPILYPYVTWVIEESISKGIQTLYFIARDGYVLKEMADMVIAARRLSIETRYLYGSRKVWRLPSVTAADFDMRYFLKWNYPRLISSFQELADILGMTIGELAAFLPFPIDKDTQLGDAVKDEVFRILAEQQEAIAEFITEKQKDNRLHAQTYLRQELDGGDSQKTAFVELIGSGYSQRCLAKLVEESFSTPLITFFYKLDDINNTDHNVNYAYFPNQLLFSNIIEILCPANHGQTVGYQKINEKWVPILGEDEGQKLDQYGFRDYMQGICSYTREMIKVSAGYEDLIQDFEVTVRLFKVLENRTDADLYDYIADMPYGIRGVEKKVTSFIPKLTDRDLRRLYIYHKGEPVYQYYSGYNIDYSLKRLTEKQKVKLEKYKRIGNWKWIRSLCHFLGTKKYQKICNSTYDMIAKKIIVYGAGKKGQLLFGQLTKGRKYHAEVLLWVDSDYEKCRKEGLPVESPERIPDVEYEQILIAVAKKELAEEIRERLIGMDIPDYRILWICPDSKIR